MGISWGWVKRVAAERYRVVALAVLGETVEDLCRRCTSTEVDIGSVRPK
jgi:hypothetical protein